jgi:hypothetical protein
MYILFSLTYSQMRTQVNTTQRKTNANNLSKKSSEDPIQRGLTITKFQSTRWQRRPKTKDLSSNGPLFDSLSELLSWCNNNPRSFCELASRSPGDSLVYVIKDWFLYGGKASSQGNFTRHKNPKEHGIVFNLMPSKSLHTEERKEDATLI